MRSILGAATLALAGLPAFAQAADEAPAGVYVIDRTHASVQWSVLHEGIGWYHGRFTGFDVQLDFDPADVARSKVTATVDPKSVETDFAKTRPAGNTTDFNNMIATRFLKAGEQPAITFTSTAISKTTETTGKMTGNLSFRGVTKPVTLDVIYVGKGVRSRRWKVGFAATGSIKRSDFGVETSAVADEIRLTIDGEFIKK
jgi:polyisoprenoid-binding protein YceI